MHGRVYAHWSLVRIFAGDPFVHREKVAVFGFYGVEAQSGDCVVKIKIDTQATGSYAASFVANVLGGARSYVTGDQVAERRVDAFEVIIAVLVRDLAGLALITGLFGHPDSAVVAQRF
ncbi:Uncharacterised protein [Mycobacteroides abscessus subsp. abscessus]|nr:Uncharacterised protein [Mycobacteroides abscessus subsp. abscessus]